MYQDTKTGMGINNKGRTDTILYSLKAREGTISVHRGAFCIIRDVTAGNGTEVIEWIR